MAHIGQEMESELYFRCEGKLLGLQERGSCDEVYSLKTVAVTALWTKSDPKVNWRRAVRRKVHLPGFRSAVTVRGQFRAWRLHLF